VTEFLEYFAAPFFKNLHGQAFTGLFRHLG
jgi:hypothetical protein